MACLTQVLYTLLDLPASQHAENNWRATFLTLLSNRDRAYIAYCHHAILHFCHA